ncbi:hypothetical protein ACTXT7_014835 [Hymenolepis weldensis]
MQNDDEKSRPSNPGLEELKEMEPNLVGEDIGGFSFVGYAVYPWRFNDNDSKRLDMNICVCMSICIEP